MSAQDAGTRQDLIENGVDRELLSIQENLAAPQDLGSALQAEVEHDLIVWPREYLETYLNTGSNGTIPLNEVQLQDVLEAAFNRDEELARNALSSLKKSLSDRSAATLTISIDGDASDRTAHPALVNGMRREDGNEFQYVLRIGNDPDRKLLRELLEKTATVVEERQRLEALSKPGATHTHVMWWYATNRTSDRGVFIDIANQPSVANQPDPFVRSPGLFESIKTRLDRLLHWGRAEHDNTERESPRVNPEFRRENSRYVAEYEADGATVRLHDKGSVEDERVVGPGFEGRSLDGVERIGIATEKDLQRKMDKDQSSARSAISQLSESLQTATGRTELVRQQRQPALTDSGIYSGRIVFETPELVIQRISAATEIAHPKSLFAQNPQIGQLLRITYHNNVASVRELHPRKLEREMAR